MISIITPIYNIEKHLQDYAENMHRLQKQFSGINEIILINNNTKKKIIKDKSLSGLKNLKVIENKKNMGYGSACNQGMMTAKGKYFLILNPDVKIGAKALEKVVGFLEGKKDAKVVSCKLLNEDGSLQYSCRRFPTLRVLLSRRIPFIFANLFKKELDDFNMADYDHKTTRRVDWVSGALMLMKDRYKFDEKYFMYFEDVDLCRRVGGVYYYPDVSAIHKADRGSSRNLRLFFSHLKSMVYYFYKVSKK